MKNIINFIIGFIVTFITGVGILLASYYLGKYVGMKFFHCEYPGTPLEKLYVVLGGLCGLLFLLAPMVLVIPAIQKMFQFFSKLGDQIIHWIKECISRLFG